MRTGLFVRNLLCLAITCSPAITGGLPPGAARLAAGFRVGVTTVWRYVTELADLLARSAPDLPLPCRPHGGRPYVVLDGTLIAIDRVGMRTGADRPYYSGNTSGTA